MRPPKYVWRSVSSSRRLLGDDAVLRLENLEALTDTTLTRLDVDLFIREEASERQDGGETYGG